MQDPADDRQLRLDRLAVITEAANIKFASGPARPSGRPWWWPIAAFIVIWFGALCGYLTIRHIQRYRAIAAWVPAAKAVGLTVHTSPMYPTFVPSLMVDPIPEICLGTWVLVELKSRSDFERLLSVQPEAPERVTVYAEIDVTPNEQEAIELRLPKCDYHRVLTPEEVDKLPEEVRQRTPQRVRTANQ